MTQPDMMPRGVLLTEAQGDWLFHATGGRDIDPLDSIVKTKRLKPSSSYLPPKSQFISFSADPHVVWGWYSLVFRKSTLRAKGAIPVEYTEAWALAHPDHLVYITGRKRSSYASKAEWFASAMESFLNKAHEKEWVTSRPGKSVALQGALVAVLDVRPWPRPSDLAMLRKQFAGIVQPEYVTTLRRGMKLIKKS